MRRMAMVLVGALVVLSAATFGAEPSGACSFAGAMLSVPEEVDAGGTLVVAGQGFFDIEGEVGGDCSGDYELVAKSGVEVTVSFATASGPVSETRPAPVTAGVEGDAERFTIGPLEFAVPADATAATVRTSTGIEESVAVASDATTTTTDAPAPPVTSAPPADPVPAQPRFTG